MTEQYMIRLTGTEADEEKLFTVIASKGKAVNPTSRTVRNGVCKAHYGPFSKEFAEWCRSTILQHPAISKKCFMEVFGARQNPSRPSV